MQRTLKKVLWASKHAVSSEPDGEASASPLSVLCAVVTSDVRALQPHSSIFMSHMPTQPLYSRHLYSTECYIWVSKVAHLHYVGPPFPTISVSQLLRAEVSPHPYPKTHWIFWLKTSTISFGGGKKTNKTKHKIYFMTVEVYFCFLIPLRQWPH